MLRGKLYAGCRDPVLYCIMVLGLLLSVWESCFEFIYPCSVKGATRQSSTR
jgi:hypothetical protein